MAKAAKSAKAAKENRYKVILAKIFEDRYTLGATEIPFGLANYKPVVDSLQIEMPEIRPTSYILKGIVLSQYRPF